MTISHEGLVVTGCQDGVARVWDSRCLDAPVMEFTDHSDYILSVAFNQEGNVLYTGSKDRTLRRWDARRPM